MCLFPTPVTGWKDYCASKSADSLIWEGVGRDYGGEIAVVAIVRAVVTPVVWGRGMCVTMWREKALAPGDARCRSSVSCFCRKLTRVFLRTRFSLLTLLFFSPFFVFALSGGFALFPRLLFKDQQDGSFLLMLLCRGGGGKKRNRSDLDAAAERSLNTGPDSQD